LLTKDNFQIYKEQIRISDYESSDNNSSASNSFTNNTKQETLFDDIVDSSSSSRAVGRSCTINGGSPRRVSVVKRRYKSGIPLSSDRSDVDSVEEVYLKSFYESVVSGKGGSKDDSDISLGGGATAAGSSGGESLYSSVGGMVGEELARTRQQKAAARPAGEVVPTKATTVSWALGKLYSSLKMKSVY
jgi:hypothetical protein